MHKHGESMGNAIGGKDKACENETSLTCSLDGLSVEKVVTVMLAMMPMITNL